MSVDYFQVQQDVRIENRWFLGDHTSTDPEDRRRLFEGEPVCGRLTIDPREGGIGIGFSLTSFGIAVASTAVAASIKKVAAEDVQIVPVEIEGYSGYSVVQCLRTIECVDELHSLFEKFPDDDPYPDRRGGYRAFEKLIIDTFRIPANAHFFRAAGWPVKLIVSRPIKKIVNGIKNAGVKFESVTQR